MSPLRNSRHQCRLRQRRGLTLIEMLLAISIMAVMAGVMGALAQAVQMSAEYTEGHGIATQHARVAFERMARAVEGAAAGDGFPGVMVLEEEAGGYRFPDMLVVWKPAGNRFRRATAAKFNEMVIFCVDPDDPHQLVEVTAPLDSRTLPAIDWRDSNRWRAEFNAVVAAANSEKVLLTQLLRSSTVDGSNSFNGSIKRGAVRFHQEFAPSHDEWAAYKAGTLGWSSMAWPQGRYGYTTGMRQVNIRMELQLMPGETALGEDPGGQQAIPFLGAAALTYYLDR